MNNLVAAKAGITQQVPAALNDRLVWLSRFGKPRVSMQDSGWSAGIRMHVADSVQGASFEVNSEFGHADPEDAVTQLIDRMLSTLAQLKG